MPELKVEQRKKKTLCIFFYFFFSSLFFLSLSTFQFLTSLPCSPRVSLSVPNLDWFFCAVDSTRRSICDVNVLRVFVISCLKVRLLCFRLRFVSEQLFLIARSVSRWWTVFSVCCVCCVALSYSVQWDFDLLLLLFRNFILKNKNKKEEEKKKLPLLDSAFWTKQTRTTFLSFCIYYACYENLNHFGMKVIGLFLFISQ